MATLERMAEGHYRLAGELELVDLKPLLSSGLDDEGGAVTVDLSGLANASSAVAALMVHWSREMRHKGAGVRYIGVPGQLMALLRLYDLPPLLDLQEAAH
ncbi:MAG: STAS domain-containing protein [bacterium]